VWLNEAQYYLVAAGENQSGEKIAASLRKLISDRRRAPVLVIATLWPDYWDQLTSLPDTGSPDSYPQARELLAGKGITVPNKFDGEDWEAAKAAALGDRRLAAAVAQAPSGKVAQFLAGVPALLERYNNAPPGAKALLHAAMDARRLGHGPYLSLAFLAQAASGYLDDDDLAQVKTDWHKALTYAAKSIHGGLAPLRQVPARPGRVIPGPGPQYGLADYLEQQGLTERAGLCPPNEFWEAVCQLTNPEDLVALALSARDFDLNGYWERLTAAALAAGAVHASIASGLQKRGRLDDAVHWYKEAAVHGSQKSPVEVIWALGRAGRLDLRTASEIIDWAIEMGCNEGPLAVACVLDEIGRLDDAIPFFRDSNSSFPEQSIERACATLAKAGRTADALTLTKYGWQSWQADGTFAIPRDAERPMEY
jgi:tetratricopeptide (TPR) repeat protein